MTLGRPLPTLTEAALLAAIALAAGCAADPNLQERARERSINATEDAIQKAQDARGVRVSFHYSDYYTLSDPGPGGCAGDAKTLYDPLALFLPDSASPADTGGYGTSDVSPYIAAGISGPTGPMPYPRSAFFPNESVRPSFVKNISVDMTDANARVASNAASACSLGNGPSAPPPSGCATFDYGAIGGIPTNLGGTLLMIGGIEGFNYAGLLPAADPEVGGFPFKGPAVSCGPVLPTDGPSPIVAPTGFSACTSSFYALGINTLPASVYGTNPGLIPGYQGTSGPTGPVSTWANISGAAGYTGPRGNAGASASYDAGLQKVLLFGGSAPLEGLGPTGAGETTFDAWLYDLKTQAWTLLNAPVNLLNALIVQLDVALDIRSHGSAPVNAGVFVSQTPVQLPKPAGARALFGYVPVPGMAMALDRMTTDGVMDNSRIDRTERLMIIGGVGPSGTLSDTHRFNPTYGPEIADAAYDLVTPDAAAPINQAALAAFGLDHGTANTNGVDSWLLNAPHQWIDGYHTQLFNNSYGFRFSSANTAALTAAPNAGVFYSSGSSLLLPDLPPIATGPTGGTPASNGAFAPLVNITPTVANAGIEGTGYVISAGGFDGNAIRNIPAEGADIQVAGCSVDGTEVGGVVAPVGSGAGSATLDCGGGLMINTRMYRTLGAGNGPVNEEYTSAWNPVTNALDAIGTPNLPAIWTQQVEGTNAATQNTVPWVGGATMLPGFNLTTNDIVYFGGLDCKQYVSDPAAPCTDYRNPGRYWSFGADPARQLTLGSAATLNTSGTITKGASWSPISAGGSLPDLAGMAAARGLDPVGNTIIVAWGGADGAASIGGNDRIFYLYNNAGTAEWAISDPTIPQLVTGDIPAELINASMVYSHVTGKYYVFGGFDPTNGLTSPVTYELSIVSTAACTTRGTCRFRWKNLNNSVNGISCYPTCPSARRSHRMAEVNYFNRNPGGNSSDTGDLVFGTNGEQNCPASAPCSYGIFMEGGTPDGLNFLADRWMFDPTANGGAGHWQLMGEFPPRTLAATTSFDYFVPSTGTIVHRALMFGGETGLHSPPSAAGNGRFFVPPTLGDTWMFDYDSGGTWNRVSLLGKGYLGGDGPGGNSSLNVLPVPPDATEFERRQGYDITDPAGTGLGTAINELSPPPTSGAIMVTRTMAPPPGTTGSATTPLRTLALPEVYLIGGRLKDGSFQPLDHVYKFCPGSSGEAFTVDLDNNTPSTPNAEDFVCDAFDANLNPTSPNPVAGFAGRWLRKAPGGTGLSPAANASFMGAGAYDSVRDRIAVFGGLKPNVVGAAVTDRANISTNGAGVFEYTPPQPQLDPALTPREGTWTYVPSCAPYDAPVGRYGHSLGFDTLNSSLVLVGGYDDFGRPLTQTLTTPDGREYETPEVWHGTYYNANLDAALNTQNPGIAITNAPCYYWKPITRFGNSIDIPTQAPPTTGLSHAASVFIPASGFNTGYYAMFDNACEKQGPIASVDPSINKLLAGGAYIDIDRGALGPDENLLLNVTYLPFGTANRRPDAQPVPFGESAVFRVHLVKTGQAGDLIRRVQQPRHMTYAATDQFPQIVQTISVLAPPTGQITQEQVVIPLGIDPTIDRIRIERLSGTGILLEASLYRMGAK